MIPLAWSESRTTLTMLSRSRRRLSGGLAIKEQRKDASGFVQECPAFLTSSATSVETVSIQLRISFVRMRFPPGRVM